MRISVSELNKWHACRLAWHYRYRERLEVPEKGPMLASGSAVHGTVEALLRREIPANLVPAQAEQLLIQHLAGQDDVAGVVRRYLPGVLRAVSRVPSDIWSAEWLVEQPVEWTWPHTFPECVATTLWGKPDCYRVTDTDIEILELKSTSSEQTPKDYFLWNPQHRYYAVLLDKMYPGRIVSVRYVVVKTGKAAADDVPGDESWHMRRGLLARTEALMLKAAGEIGKLEVVPNYSRACSWCDFKPLCEMDITGGDGVPLKEELYTVREPRE